MVDASHARRLGRKHGATVSMWDLGSEINASMRTAYVKFPWKVSMYHTLQYFTNERHTRWEIWISKSQIYPVQWNPCSDHEKEGRRQQIPSSMPPVLRHCFFERNGQGNRSGLYQLFLPLPKGCHVLEGKEVIDRRHVFGRHCDSDFLKEPNIRWKLKVH